MINRPNDLDDLYDIDDGEDSENCRDIDGIEIGDHFLRWRNKLQYYIPSETW